MDLEEVEEGAEAEVLEEEEDGAGSGHEGRLDLRRPAFVPIAGEFHLTGGGRLVFKQDVLTAERS